MPEKRLPSGPPPRLWPSIHPPPEEQRSGGAKEAEGEQDREERTQTAAARGAAKRSPEGFEPR